MILLDTDHLNMLIHHQGARSERLLARMSESPDQEFATTIVTVEEQMRGWLAEIRRHRELSKQRTAYQRLRGLVEFWTESARSQS